MKPRKGIIFLVLSIITIIYIIHPLSHEEELYEDSFKDSIIRFHIVANSDKEEDQQLKLKIRDEILRETQAKFENSKSLDETRHIIKANLDNIKSLAEKVIEEEGKDFPVEVYLGTINFPTRKYGDIVFPAGEYEALQVTIGEGKGKNWWCVMFPPLCFVDETYSIVDEDSEEKLKYLLTEEEYDSLKNHKVPVKIKFKLLEILKELFQ